MKIQLVRHATLLIELDGRRLLIDPMLSAVGKLEPPSPFTPACNENDNPLVPLPSGSDLSKVLSRVEAVFVTHTHVDHFDKEAIATLHNDLPNNLPIFCQLEDAKYIRDAGFSTVNPVEKEKDLQWHSIEVSRTSGQHGPGNQDGRGGNMGPVSGFVLRSQNGTSLYIAGDTIWCPEVEAALKKHQPDIVVVNAGAAQLKDGFPITMTEGDVAEVCRHIPSATVIAVHMEAINHCLLTRKVLKDFVERVGLSERVRIPADGERI